MIQYVDALEQIIQAAGFQSDLPQEIVPVLESMGRICSQDCVSSEIIPPFDNSAMDGFAVHSEWTRSASENNPLRFRILGSIAAGDVPPKNPSQDGAWEIMTGAPFPDSFDASIRIEDILVIKDGTGRPKEIEIHQPAEPEQNRRKAGEDFGIGTPVVKRGQRVMPEHVLALASLGIVKVPVFKRPRIGIISTGSELVPMNETPGEGQIRNSTAPFLVSALHQMGMDPVHLGTVFDDPAHFQTLIQQVLHENFDLILTTGAVSMGKYDFVTEGIREIQAESFFHKVAIRPGKPLLFARLQNGSHFLGLPGNPVSGVVGLRFFVEPYLRALCRQKPERPIRAYLKERIKKPEGLRCFYKARMEMGEGGPQVSILPGQMSFMVSPLLDSTVWAMLPEEGLELPQGASIDVYPLWSSPYDWRSKWDFESTRNLRGSCC